MPCRPMAGVLGFVAITLCGCSARTHAPQPSALPRAQWFAAADAGDIPTLARLHSAGVPIDARDTDGRTALIWAAASRRHSAAVWLVERGADVNARDAEGISVVANLLGRSGDTGVVPLLLDRGADVNATDGRGTSVLAVACASDPTVARLLLNRGADPNGRARTAGTEEGYVSPLAAAIRAGHRDLVLALLRLGAEPDMCDWAGRTPLAEAAALGDVESASLLISHGADPNAREDATRSSARRTSCMATVDERRRMDDARRAPLRQDGASVLQIARAAGQHQVVDLLIKAGAR